MKQKHFETCLARSLMTLLKICKDVDLPDAYEIDTLIHSMKFERDNISLGHLDKITKDFDVDIEWVVDSRIFYEFTKNKLMKGILMIKRGINKEIISKKIKSSPIIVYLDGFYLWEKNWELYFKYHFPHFVILLSEDKKDYTLIDPNDGITKKISKKKILEGIKSLKRRLWMSPMIIRLV